MDTRSFFWDALLFAFIQFGNKQNNKCATILTTVRVPSHELRSVPYDSIHITNTGRFIPNNTRYRLDMVAKRTSYICLQH